MGFLDSPKTQTFASGIKKMSAITISDEGYVRLELEGSTCDSELQANRVKKESQFASSFVSKKIYKKI
jgi:hypothetical protein